MRLLALSLGGLALALAIASSVAARPGRGSRTDSNARLDRNDECIACHADIAREWSHSLHRQSFEDPMFQAALARERKVEFCRSCHAPESDPRREPTVREAAAGVACVTCHLDGKDAAVLAGPSSRAGADDREVPHALRRTAELASPEACAGCHEFWFPSGGRAGHQLKMQRTLSEHEHSELADRSCQSCHMPPARSDGAVHHDHGFTVVGEPRMLRAAVAIEATRPEPGRVVIELRPRAVGHAFPTGDLFRRLVVELHADDGSWSTQRVLAREFVDQRVGHGQLIRVERSDERVGVGRGPRVVEFELPAELHARPLRWVLVYERALEDARGSRWQADLWDRTPFAEGELPIE
jgi:hypothetical protein